MIILMAFPVMKGGDGEYHSGRPMRVKEWPNDHFYPKFDIFDEENWWKVIEKFRRKGKKLSRKDDEGNYYAYAVVVKGADVEMRKKFFGPAGWLCPDVKNMRDKNGKFNVKWLIDYNKKHIYPRLD